MPATRAAAPVAPVPASAELSHAAQVRSDQALPHSLKQLLPRNRAIPETGEPRLPGCGSSCGVESSREISGLNLVIDPTIQGTVDVALRDVPWDQALDIILRANKLGYVIDGTIVRIAPLTVLADEEAQRRSCRTSRRSPANCVC